VAAPDWLARLAAHFEDPRVLAVGGSQACPADATPIQRDIHAVLSWMGFLGGYTKSARLVVETPHNPSCNVMYRRETLLAAGGFRAGMYPGEDVDLDFRLRTWHMDARILYDPDARVAHYRPRTLKGWFRMMQRYGDSSGVNVRLHGFFRLLHAAPLVFGGAGAAWMAWTLSRPFQGLTGALGALLLVTAFVAWRSRDLPMPRLGRRLVMLLAIPFTFSFGFLRGLLREPPRARRAP
jgi:cellulose synthase/poly-beta-1,6-N-acetylglucosamine synthase-like glycosyltransferase